MSSPILYGDNLLLTRELEPRSIDLIYADPPYASGRTYNMVVEDSMAHQQAYEDTWAWGAKARETLREFSLNARSEVERRIVQWLEAMEGLLGRGRHLAYLVMMAPRSVLFHEVLKTTGSMYLHCDPTMSHYLKALYDAIFGPRNFRGEIIWPRHNSHNNARRPGPRHDTILFYTKSDKYTWNPVYHEPLSDGGLNEEGETNSYDGEDEYGRWKRRDLSGPGERTGDSGQPWQGISPPPDRHWAIPKRLRAIYEERTGRPLEGTYQECFTELDELGLIVHSKNGSSLGYKKYLGALVTGKPLQDIWDDIAPVRGEERVAFDGQKPVKLIERIIQASSNPGDLVLDPFLGSGTTAIAAQRLDRRWIGFELKAESSQFARNRLIAEFGEGVFTETYTDPTDLKSAEDLASRDRHAFAAWCVRRFHGVPRGPCWDKGIDGDFTLKGFSDNKGRKGVIQVKSGGTKRGDVQAFCTATRRAGALVGVFIAFQKDITRGMRDEAAAEGTYNTGINGDTHEYPRIQIIPVERLANRELRFGGADLPGVVVQPDLSETPRAIRRRTQNVLDFMFECEESGSVP